MHYKNYTLYTLHNIYNVKNILDRYMLSQFIIGSNIINILFQTITVVGTSCLHAITYITALDKPYVYQIQKKLLELDIEPKIKIVTSLENDLQKEGLPNYINVSLEYVKESLEKINIIMDKIKERVIYHETKYCNKWRTLDCNDLLLELEKNDKILDKRLKMCLKFVYLNNSH